ncbi:TPA: hypothetical protein I8Y90_000345 [Legionella pneumophila]|nr:hypothetical protein [Legionella pneumophila]
MTEYIKIRDTLEKVKDNPHELMETLLSLYRKLPSEKLDFYEEVSNFINDEKIDIYDVALNVISKGKNIFIVSHLLSQLANNIKIINSETFLAFLTLYYEETTNDLAANIFYEPIKKLAENADSGLEKIEQEILINKEQRLYGYLNAIYVGYAKRDILVGYSKFMDMINSGAHLLISLGLRGLGLLQNIPEDLFTEIKKTCLSYSEFEDEDFISNATFTLYKLIKYDEKLHEKIIFLSQKNIAKVQFELLNLISTKGEIDQTDLEIICNICQYDLCFKGISDQIDFICFKLLEKNNLIAFLKIFNHWIHLHSIKEIQKTNITTIFKLSIPIVLQRHEIMKKLVTDWFNSDDPRYHIALMYIFSYLSTHNPESMELDTDILSNLKLNDVLYIVRKILGYVYDDESAIFLIASILKMKKISTSVEKIINETLAEIYGDRVPLKTKIILENLLKSDYSYSRKARSIINKCIERISNKMERIETLGKLNELQPNVDYQIKLSLAFQKFISKASDDALENSPLISSVNKVKIKTGNGWFQYSNGSYSQITPMQKFTHTLEFPREMMLDEIGSVIQRTAFQQAKRNES